jgi:uncharacterized NAD(P)/FAD-binding protein YdhS
VSARNSIAIVGGGASGVILTAHLLRQPDPNLRVTLIEKRAEFGRGRAYSTDLPDHQLNVRALGMSGYADQPEHFWRWLQKKGLAKDNPDFFASRSLYGVYLNELLDDLVEQERSTGRLHLVNAECTTISPTASGVEVQLTSGASIIARMGVLAVGHDEAPAPAQYFAVRSGSEEDTPIDPQARVLILGTGLSMVDTWLTLQHRGHRGEVIAVSRRGLLPSPHRQGHPIRLDSADVPLGTTLSYFVRWFRDLVHLTESQGGNWRDVVDGLRPYNQIIWQSWSARDKRRFLERTKAWWDIHRHRMPPEMHARISRAVSSGQLVLLAGRVLRARKQDAAYVVDVQARVPNVETTFEVLRIYDCTGIVKDVSEGSIRVIRTLTDRGLARSDPLRIGLDVTPLCAVVAANGTVSNKLYAVGPLTRGAFFEIDAIPDIRVQCDRLASRLTS